MLISRAESNLYGCWLNVVLFSLQRKKERNKEKDEKPNGVSNLDPYASDDDDNLRRIASSFESKYVSCFSVRNNWVKLLSLIHYFGNVVF